MSGFDIVEKGSFLFFNFFPTYHTLWDDRKFPLLTASATGGQQALHHFWMCRTLVCGTNAKSYTAELLIVKWIQLLLIFSWGFKPLEGVINLDSAFWIVTPLALEQRYRLQEFSELSIFGFPQRCQNIWQAGQSCQESAWTVEIVYTK